MKRISRTRILASFVLWMAAVASVAAIAWLAIDTAGRQVTSSPVAAQLPSRISTMPAAPVPLPSATATASAQVTASDRPSSTPRPSPHNGTSWRAHSRSPAPGNGRWGGDPSMRGGVYSTAGGRIRVSCQSHAITLDGGYAQPAPGWSVQVLSGGPAQVQVVFAVPGHQALLVIAGCPDGHPQFDQDQLQGGSPTPAGRSRP